MVVPRRNSIAPHIDHHQTGGGAEKSSHLGGAKAPGGVSRQYDDARCLYAKHEGRRAVLDEIRLDPNGAI